MPVATGWSGVAYGDGTFVAVGGGTNAATSPDGLTWTLQTMPVSATWNGVAYGGGQFVAVSNGINAATSPDGVTWTQRTMPSSTNWRAVTHGAGLFVAVPYGATNAATSPDGITWTTRNLGLADAWRAVSYGGGQFVAVVEGTAKCSTSPDGITWTLRNLPAALSWYSITYGGGTWVATANTANFATSPDGITWVLRGAGQSGSWQSSAYGDGVFTALDASNSAFGASSLDGNFWGGHLGAPGPMGSTTFGAGRFVAVGSGASSTLAASATPQILAVSLYRAPVRTVVTHMTLSGPTAATCSIRLGRMPLLTNTVIAPSTSYELYQVLEPGEMIGGWCGPALGVSAVITGYEA
jgi:hypothetical protein